MRNAFLRCLAAYWALAAFRAADAAAEPPAFRQRGWEAALGGEAGCAWLEIADPTEDSTSKTCGAHLFARFRHMRTPFGLEAGVTLPHGFGAMLMLDAWRGDRFRLHLFDVGAFFPLGGRHMSVAKVDRSWDLVLGAGVEALIRPRLAVTVDWRMFLPNPSETLPTYGDFTRLLYEEAGHGGQLWIGVVWHH